MCVDYTNLNDAYSKDTFLETMESRTANTAIGSTNCSMFKVREEGIVEEIGSDPTTFFRSET